VSYLILFCSAFLSATILPFSSELVLFGLIQAGHSPWVLFWVALLGNTLGSVLNYVLGLTVQRFKNRPWFYIKPEGLEKFESIFRRYGLWSLLFSWVPIVGDPLTFLAGVARVRFMLFILFVVLGKAGRYAVVLSLSN
jgi:membrane protein YqaA with SNARE-associated domain